MFLCIPDISFRSLLHLHLPRRAYQLISSSLSVVLLNYYQRNHRIIWLVASSLTFTNKHLSYLDFTQVNEFRLSVLPFFLFILLHFTGMRDRQLFQPDPLSNSRFSPLLDQSLK